MTHTPGPWTTKPGLFFICHVGNNLKDPGIWSKAIPKDGSPFPFGDKKADARLIAAAPDMLEALKATLKHIDDDMNSRPVVLWKLHETVRDAIDKAMRE